MNFPIVFESRYDKHHRLQPSIFFGFDIKILLSAYHGNATIVYSDDEKEEFTVANIWLYNMRDHMKQVTNSLILGGGLQVSNRVGVNIFHRIGLSNIINEPISQDDDSCYRPSDTAILISLGLL